MKTIGFVGAGIMGKPMIRNLRKAGFDVSVYARRPGKVQDLVEEGFVLCKSLRELAEKSEALITIVGDPFDVEYVYFGEGRILESARPGTYLIDMTTTSPSLDQRIYEEGKQRGLHVLDAPVTGGDVGAVKGTLSVLVGGDREDYEACLPVFQAVGNNITYMGPSGNGQHAKIANQIAIAGTLSGICEAFAYAEEKGLHLKTLFDAISTGAAGSMQMTTNGAKIIAEDYSPGFKMEHFIKDLSIAMREITLTDLDLPVMIETLKSCLGEQEKGHGEDGTQALIRHYRE